ncbi:MAG: GGDEF domain-containing protein, partial [Nitrospinaceae bacterium]
IDHLIKKTSRDPSVIYIAVYDSSFEEWARYNTLPAAVHAQELLRQRGTLRFGDVLTVTRTIVFPDDETGFLILAYSLERLNDQLTQQVVFAGIIFLVILALGILIDFIFGNLITRQIKQLTQAVLEFTKGKHDVKVSITGNDEIGKLARAFEQMRFVLHQSIHDLDAANKKLNKEVDRRRGEEEKREELIQELVSAKQSLEKTSRTDPLTRLSNRRDMSDKMRFERSRSDRHNLLFSILIGDVDHFKKVNDNYGHEAGDSVLVAVSKALKESVRAHDMVGRWGGEEFLILLPGTGADGALTAAEKILEKMESIEVVDQGQTIKITMSVGGAVYKSGDSIESCINEADKALYEAKEGGRNRVVIRGAIPKFPRSIAPLHGK